MSQYPVISAGQRISAALLQSLIPSVIVKQNSTSRASTTTRADDPDLTFQLAASSKYLVEFSVRFSDSSGSVVASPGTPQVPNIQTSWTVPSGASGNKQVSGPGSTFGGNGTGTDNSGDISTGHVGVHGFTTAISYGNRGKTSSQLYLVETGLVTTSSAGACTFQWAQITSSTVSTTIQGDSFMRITQLA